MNNKSFEIRPWGEFHILSEQEDFKIKKIIIYPGQRISYQFHNKRSELWMVIKGYLSVIIDGKEYYEDDKLIKKETYKDGNLINSETFE